MEKPHSSGDDTSSVPKAVVPEGTNQSRPGWPPRGGVQFFLLWMAGMLFWSISALAVGLLKTKGLITNSDTILLVSTVVLGLWQALLLFRRINEAVWWPLLTVSAWASANPEFTGFDPVMYFVTLLLSWLVLSRARRRAWLWPIAQLSLTFAAPIFDWLYALIEGQRGTIAHLGRGQLSAEHTYLGASAGIELLFDAVLAAILTWCMPPLPKDAGIMARPPQST